jgi:uncharacterized membrane protein YjdF
MQPSQPVGERDAGRETGPLAFYAAVAAVASVIFAVISLAPREGGVAKYRWSFLFLVPIVWALVALRRRLALRPVPFGLFALALVLHDLGAFGWYQRKFVGVQYDWYVHALFGFVGGLIVARLLQIRVGLGGPMLAALVVLVVTGFGGLHEIVEAASTWVLGTEYGMLVTGADNPYDTQEDLLCNVVGSVAAAVVRRFVRGWA